MSMCPSDLGYLKLSLDSMGVLKVVLFIIEAVLLTDCARGESCLTNFLSFLLIFHVIKLESNTRLIAHYGLG